MTAGPLDHDRFLAWLDGYERLWRTAGADGLDALFSDDAEYLQSPYEKPHKGLAAIAAMWDDARESPDETFTMERAVVAVDGDTGIARVVVRYGDPVDHEYTDLWVVRFDDTGRATRFEEWPYWPSRGYTAMPRTPTTVVDAADVVTDRWAEWVRSGALSSGVYRIPAGQPDTQSPHDEDEVYVVLRGAASLVVDDVAHPVRTGTLAFVPARAAHRFVDVTEDLEVAVVFAPPESG
jgi:mannose-6-phosphate isomerase-like protein (cupin superfamily)